MQPHWRGIKKGRRGERTEGYDQVKRRKIEEKKRKRDLVDAERTGAGRMSTDNAYSHRRGSGGEDVTKEEDDRARRRNEVRGGIGQPVGSLMRVLYHQGAGRAGG